MGDSARAAGAPAGLRHVLNVSACAVALAAGAGGAAWAQGEAQAAESGQTDRVLVTGTRIRQTGMSTPTPVTALDFSELTQISPTNVIEAMSQLPQFFGNSTPNEPGFFTTSPGAGNLNLRGLGVNRTLTLLDGRRVVPTTRQGSTDINLFPESLIENVEVVTGGASAAYGTDAVAGVVNFILDTDFTGVKGHAQAGITSRGDGENFEGSLTFGTPVGARGHLLLSADYYEQAEIAGYDGRDWYESWGLVTNPDPNGPRLLTLPNVVSTTFTEGGLILQPGSRLDRLMFLSDGSATPFILSDIYALGGTGSQSITNGGSGYNPSTDPYLAQLQTHYKRSSVFGYFDYALTDDITVYVQGIYGTNFVDLTNTPSVMMPPVWTATIYQDNAFLPEELRQIMIDEGLDSFGFSRYGSSADLATNRAEMTNEMYSVTAGFDANITRSGFLNGWNVRGYYQYGTNERENAQVNWIRTDRVFAALDAVRDPNTGAIVCRAALAGHPQYQDCVPINLFGAGNISQEGLDYVTTRNVGTQTVTTPLFISTPDGDGYEAGIVETYDVAGDKIIDSWTKQHVVEFSADGELWRGFGAGPVFGAFGASYRKESVYQLVRDPSNYASDPEIIVSPNDPANGVQGVPTGFVTRPTGYQFSNFPNIKGDLDVKEVFGELLVPLVVDMPLARQLNLNLAARYADYTGSGGIWSYKYGLDWQLTDELRLRGTGSRDVRAATLSERYDRQGTGLSVDDPLFGGQNFSVGGTIGGNPNVEPEKADTYTIGLIYQPLWANGLAVSLDYYSINIAGAIGQLGAQRIVDDCLAGAAELCDRIRREPGTNLILNIENIFLNINEAKVSGADLEVSYTRPISLFGGNEHLRSRLFASWLQENSTTNVGAPKLDEAGEIGANDLPRWRVMASLSYTRGPFEVFLQERWISSGKRDVTQVEGVDIDRNKVDDVFYTDMNLTYTMDVSNGTIELFGHVMNLFDASPPIAASYSSFAGATQANASLHDVIGRRFVGGVRFHW